MKIVSLVTTPTTRRTIKFKINYYIIIQIPNRISTIFTQWLVTIFLLKPTLIDYEIYNSKF